MARPRSDSLIDRVDSTDHPVGVIQRGAALEQNANFRTAHAFLMTRDGRLLLQRLAPTRDRHPGRWGSSVAAYLFAGESYVDAVRRRAEDELGVRPTLTFVLKDAMNDGGSVKFVALFMGTSDHARVADPGHIAQVEPWDLEDIADQIRLDATAFTPTFCWLFSRWSEVEHRVDRA